MNTFAKSWLSQFFCYAWIIHHNHSTPTPDPDSKVHGANMGPTWGPPGSCRPQVGPLLAPWTLLSGELIDPTSTLPELDCNMLKWHLQPLVTTHLTSAVSLRIPKYHAKFCNRGLYSLKCQNYIIKFTHLGPLLLTWINFNPSMNK